MTTETKKPLTDTALKAAKPAPKPYKISAGHGLFLLVSPKGSKLWQYKYRITVGTERVEKKGSLGSYPDVSLADARRAHGVALDHLKAGADPVAVKRKDEAAKGVEREKNRPFGQIVDEWLTDLIEPIYTGSTLRRYQRHAEVLKEGFGRTLLADVRLIDLTSVLRAFQDAGKHDTRRRISVDAKEIMGMALERGYITFDYFAGATFRKGYTDAAATHKPRPALTGAVEFGRLLGDLDTMPDRSGTALRLLALLFLRPGELLRLEWKHIDWKNSKLIVPFRFLKMASKRKDTPAFNRDLEVPLSRQAISLLRDLQRRTGNHVHLFPTQSTESKKSTMPTTTLNKALARLDYTGIHCPHGFRSSASTLLNAERRTVEGEEILRWPEQRALIELQLDHNDASVQAIYDRGGRWKERCQLMQLWADRIDEMRGQRSQLRLVA